MEKVYYKISEVSEMLDVPLSKLRYWEKVIPQLAPHKKEEGRVSRVPSLVQTSPPRRKACTRQFQKSGLRLFQKDFCTQGN